MGIWEESSYNSSPTTFLGGYPVHCPLLRGGLLLFLSRTFSYPSFPGGTPGLPPYQEAPGEGGVWAGIGRAGSTGTLARALVRCSFNQSPISEIVSF